MYDHMIAPTVNINGTDGKELLASYFDAISMLQAIDDKLGRMTPHGRDYPEADYQTARMQHKDMRADVERLIQKLTAIGLKISNQVL